MKLYVTTTSPFVRKVLVSAHELGIEGRIERHERPIHVIRRVAEVVEQNPLGQVPTLIADDGTAIFDSRVICEYLHGLVPGSGLFPAEPKPRLQALVEQALADGLLNAALLGRQELSVRPQEKSWTGWYDAMMAKIVSALDRFEDFAPGFGERIDIGTISAASAASYLDFRYADFDWRAGRPRLAGWYETISRRRSFLETTLRLPTPK
jgi:glutathione S-transferase